MKTMLSPTTKHIVNNVSYFKTVYNYFYFLVNKQFYEELTFLYVPHYAVRSTVFDSDYNCVSHNDTSRDDKSINIIASVMPQAHKRQDILQPNETQFINSLRQTTVIHLGARWLQWRQIKHTMSTSSMSVTCRTSTAHVTPVDNTCLYVTITAMRMCNCNRANQSNNQQIDNGSLHASHWISYVIKY